MTTRRNATRSNTSRSNTKKSLGNLLREEVQKETDPPPVEADEPGADLEPEASSEEMELAPSQATEDSGEALARLQAQLEEAQQQTATLVAEKTDLEQRLQELTQNLHQEAQWKTQIQQEVTQLQTELSNAQAQIAQQVAPQIAQPVAPQHATRPTIQPTASTALTVLPRSAQLHTLPRAFSRPILDRPTPWDIPRRPLVITGAKPKEPSDLSDEDMGWFD